MMHTCEAKGGILCEWYLFMRVREVVGGTSM